ncbi:MAG: hypothetical protein A2497_02860 [Candidatus Firestonebacteria bacterium RifOxyC12_full_39_7]|nr:MAG: hypothetical protein A2497_02860 [Candidatus Firestonebacteria bacterium RifOxyC12_full_39_7]
MALNIGKKILLMSILSFALVAAAMIGTFKYYDYLITDNVNKIQEDNEALLSFKDVQLKLRNYKDNRDGKLITAAKSGAKDETTGFKIILTSRRTNILKSGKPADAAKIENALARCTELESSLAKLAKGYDDLEVSKALMASEEMAPKVKELIKDDEKDFDKNIEFAKKIVFSAIGAILLIIMSFSFGISGSMVGPINKLTTISINSSKGDLTQSINTSGTDEIAELSRAFNTLVQNLAKIVIELRNTSQHISKYSVELSAVSEELNFSSLNVSTSVQGIARATFVQRKQIEKTTQVIDTMANSVSAVAQRAQTQADKTSLATTIAERGSQTTKETISKMRQISNTVTNSSNMVKHLKERSNQIGFIVEAITKIAEQTNLLAINTAIEAARAGEGARELRVIADEIRKLAEASGKAADQIVRLLKEIQGETNQVITATETGAVEVEEGVSYVNKTGAALEELTKAVWDISNLATEISKNTLEQSSGFEQVRKAITTVTSISEENALSTEGVLKLTQRESELTKKITESSSQLKKLSEELTDLVTKFKVNE